MAAIVHSQMLRLYAGPRSISGSFGASPGQAVVTAYLSQPSCVLSANAEGVVEDYTPASTMIVVEVSGRTDTTNWTISTAKSTSVGAVTVTGATVSVSGMTDDAGWVDITASKAGYEPVTRRFTLAKVRQKGGIRTTTTLPANPSEVGGELAIFLDVADQALRGMYGWSGTAWVKTGELLNGSVTADKLAADAIQATKFAAGIEPVSIVSLLPNVVGYTGPKLVLLTTDNKLYRYTGSNWGKELPAEDLTGQLVADQLASNSVTTGKIQAGAVSTDQLAAKAVTATKMVLADTSNVYPDYDILDSEFYGGGAFARVASSSTDRGAYVLQIAANASEVRVPSGWFQVEPSADYFVEISAHQSVAGTAGAAAAYVELGSFTGGTNAPTVTRAELILRRVNTTSSARADVAITTADTERRARLVFVREAGGTGVAEFGGPVIRRRNNAKLIVDGSIIANKLATDAVETRHILAGAVTAEKLTVNKLSAISADLGDATAGTFTLSSTGFIKGGATSYTEGTGFWLGYDGGKYKFRAGAPGSSGFSWDGSAFNVYGPDGSVTISSGVVDWDKIAGAGKTALENTASTALTNANAAQTAANTANAALADIAADNKLTAVEKQSAANEWGIINRERASIQAQAAALGISAELGDYNYTYAVLNDYISPLLQDISSTSVIDGATFRDKWAQFYEYRQRLINKMAAVAATKADWSNVQRRPDDPHNLCIKSSFEDGELGAWIGTVSVETANTSWSSKALHTQARDAYLDDWFSVTPGEKIEVEAALWAFASNHQVGIGLHVVDKLGASIAWPLALTSAAGEGWAIKAGTITIPDNASKARCFVQMDGYSGFGSGLVTNLRYRRFTQITSSNVSTYIANAAIGNAQIGGNLWSTNWNYAGGTGWLLDRSGNFYGNNIYARGDIEASSLKANTAMVQTLNIAGNAVIVPTLVEYPSAAAYNVYQNGTEAEWTLLSDVVTVNVDCSALVFIGCNDPITSTVHTLSVGAGGRGHYNWPTGTEWASVRVYRNGSLVKRLAQWNVTSTKKGTGEHIGTYQESERDCVFIDTLIAEIPLVAGTNTIDIRGWVRMADGDGGARRNSNAYMLIMGAQR